jgi:hypothetical protein
MFRTVFALLLLLSICTYNTFAQEKFTVVKDLSGDWMCFVDGAYKKFDAELETESVHFSLDRRSCGQCLLKLNSPRDLYLFVDGQLLKRISEPALISLDSLTQTVGSENINVTIYQAGLNARRLETLLIRTGNMEDLLDRKPGSDLRDFISTAGLLLIVMFVAMIKVNSKLASDYFSLQRILSLREAEDNQSHSRFAISSNLWFYIFCSLLAALYFLLVFGHLPDDFAVARSLDNVTFGIVVWQWIKLAAFIFVLLMVKIAVIYLLSNLFGMTGIAGVHFFNWIRFSLIIFGGMLVVLFVYYISRGINPSVYLTFQYILLTSLVGWIVILFLKLNNRAEHSMFHLFSYICATELIPLLITIKVLFQ